MTPLQRAWQKNWPEIKCAFRGGMPRFVLARRPPEPQRCIPVFCYHVIEPEAFAADLVFLRRNGYTTLDADQLADHMEGQLPPPPRAVVLTIDDGMLDLYTIAFPLLCEFDMKAVAFIAPGLHERQRASEHDPCRLCSWNEIFDMHISGIIDFQSHTYEHRYVPRWPQPCGIGSRAGRVPLRRGAPMQLKHDLAAARSLLQQRLSKTVQHLAFPQYTGTPRGIRAALESGYRALWWGVLPGRRGNAVGDPLTQVVRVSGEFVRRLPGAGRISLANIVAGRCTRRLVSLPMPPSIPERRPARTPSREHV
jgi:peptidoglycan/xylan/chitin deacetylase (PgdA/CDA1 family)